MNVSVVIPTYKREKDLRLLVNSIFAQSRMPQEIILVDDDALSETVLANLRETLIERHCQFVYFKKDHKRDLRGSASSRNIGMNCASNEIVFILDDDLILDPLFFENIMRAWEINQDSKLIGVGAVISNNRQKNFLEYVFNTLFCLRSKLEWDVTNVGYQVWNDAVTQTTKGFYIHGGVCSYKKSLVTTLNGFSLFSGGRTALEDVDFCLRAKQHGYFFLVVPSAKADHFHSVSGRESDFVSGFKEEQNRKMIFQTLCIKTPMNAVWFFWSSIGWILRKIIVGHFETAFGMMVGFIKRTT